MLPKCYRIVVHVLAVLSCAVTSFSQYVSATQGSPLSILELMNVVQSSGVSPFVEKGCTVINRYRSICCFVYVGLRRRAAVPHHK